MLGHGRWMGHGHSRTRTDSGAAAVEFALVLFPFLVLLFGMIQYGLYFYSAQTGSQVADSAVRQLSVGNCQSAGSLQAFVTDQLGAAATGNIQTVTTYTNPDGTTPADPKPANVVVGGTVTLQISFDTLNMHFPFVPFLSNPKVSRTVEARVEDTSDEGCGT